MTTANFTFILALALLVFAPVRAEVSQSDFEAIKKEMLELREKLTNERAAAATEVDAVRNEMSQMRQELNGIKRTETPVVSEYDKMLALQRLADQPVTTSTAKLRLGGLVQVWYYAIERDTNGLFSNPKAGIVDHNIAVSQNTFQIRRTELDMTLDINSYITAYVKTDFAAEADAFRGTFAQLAGSNQGYVKASLNNKIGAPIGSAPAILQDALINVHDLIPHHDLTVGQMLPYFSEEDFAPNGCLDFVERSWIGNAVPRDTGAVLHGAWWYDGGGGAYEGAGNSGRFQYWLSTFNSPGYYQDEATQFTADNNASKDFLGRVMLRPMWNYCLGRLELSGAGGFGQHGSTPLNQAIHDINATAAVPSLTGTPKTWGQRWSAFAEYQPRSFAQGLWLKYEYAWTRDTTANIPGRTGLFRTNADAPPDHYQPFPTTGYYASAGYNLENTDYAYYVPIWARGFEFDLRFQRYTNVWIQDPSANYHVDTYATNQGTIGINYYIKGNNAKIQANYDIVRDPRGNADYRFHAVKNDVFSMNFQVMW